MTIVYVMCKNQTESLEIGRILIEKRLAACINVIPTIKSIYRWKGKIIEDSESILLAKTNIDRVEKLVQEVKEMHSYDVPCIEVIEVSGGNKDYFKWINSELMD
jgi:periplasmic divalent cation tolerance protein